MPDFRRRSRLMLARMTEREEAGKSGQKLVRRGLAKATIRA